jgi:DnaJ like chaperone protein
MSIWEKLALAITQSSMGPRLGPLLGGAHNQEHDQGDTSVDNEVPFTVGVIALSAKIAKADGVVTRDEVKAFKVAFRVSDGEMKHAARVFNLAKEEVTGYEAFVDELVTIFKGNRKLLEDVLEGLFHIAKADVACKRVRHYSHQRVAAVNEAYDALVKQRRPSSVSPVASAERA